MSTLYVGYRVGRCRRVSIGTVLAVLPSDLKGRLCGQTHEKSWQDTEFRYLRLDILSRNPETNEPQTANAHHLSPRKISFTMSHSKLTPRPIIKLSSTRDSPAHSGKRNTSLAFFTSHERSQLKSTWGSQATRLTRDSFLPFASCRLCLQPSRDPVACSSHGDIFCRECAVSNLLAQRKEIKRLEKEDERRRQEHAELGRDRTAEERERAIRDFEATMMGLEGRKAGTGGGEVGQRGTKRKFELDEAEMLKNAMEERAKARRALDEEKVCLSPQSIPFRKGI